MLGKKETEANGKNPSEAGAKSAAAELDKKIEQEIHVHHMPKTYVGGRFDFQAALSKLAAAQEPAAKASKPGDKKAPKPFAISATANPSRRTGLIVIGGSLVLLAGLGFGAYKLLGNSPAKVPGKQVASKPVQQETKPSSSTPIDNIPSIIPAASSTIPVDTVPTSTEPIATSTPIITEPQPASISITDSDFDGLSTEEELALGTSDSLTDSDFDGYNDRAELMSLYDPAAKNGKLNANINIATYSNTAYGYSVLYPKAWELKPSKDGNSVVINAVDQSFFQIIVQPNADKLSINDWYSQQFAAIVPSEAIVSSTDWDAIKSDKGLIWYLTDKAHSNIYIISYTPVNDKILLYNSLFEMMIKSLTLKK